MDYDLATIDDSIENAIAYKMIQSNDDDPWIGLKRQDTGSKDSFQWSDGTLLTKILDGTEWNRYTNWRRNEPNNQVV